MNRYGKNIRYGKPDATDEEVIRAAKAAVTEFIAEPVGYDTDIGQRGETSEDETEISSLPEFF